MERAPEQWNNRYRDYITLRHSCNNTIQVILDFPKLRETGTRVIYYTMIVNWLNIWGNHCFNPVILLPSSKSFTIPSHRCNFLMVGNSGNITGLGIEHLWVWVLPMPLTSLVYLGKFYNLCKLHFLHGINNTYLAEHFYDFSSTWKFKA